MRVLAVHTSCPRPVSPHAVKGVELVKENLVINERLNAFVGTIGSIPPLRGAVQFPSVQVRSGRAR